LPREKQKIGGGEETKRKFLLYIYMCASLRLLSRGFKLRASMEGVKIRESLKKLVFICPTTRVVENVESKSLN